MHTAARRRAFTSVGAVVPPMKLVVTWAALTLLVQPVTASNPKGLHISDEEAQLHFGPNRECTIELKAGPPPYLESNCPIQAPPPHPAAPPSPPPSAPPSSPPPPVVYAYVLGGLTYGNANSGYGHTDSYSVMNPLIGASAERYNTETGAWSNLPTAPVDFSYAGCAAEVNGSLYYTRGTALLVYDPATITWEQKADMPLSRDFHACAGLGGDYYAVGGPSSALNGARCHKYTPSTNTWSEVAPMSTWRHALSMVAYDGCLYVFGGINSAPLTSAEKYDPTSNTWTALLSMPGPYPNTHNGFVYGNAAVSGYYIYLAGGTICGVCGNNGDPKVIRYHPATNTYDTSIAPMGVKRTSFALSASPDGRIWAYGGHQDGGGVGMNTIEVYDPNTDTWTDINATMSLPHGYTTGVVF